MPEWFLGAAAFFDERKTRAVVCVGKPNSRNLMPFQQAILPSTGASNQDQPCLSRFDQPNSTREPSIRRVGRARGAVLSHLTTVKILRYFEIH